MAINDYIEELHTYKYHGEVVPSVTQIADPISFEKLNMLDKYMLEQKANLGTRVHAYCQEFALTKEYPEDIDEDCIPYVDAFVQWFFDFNVETQFVELGMWCETFAGRCDLIAKIDDKIYIIDLKTTSTINKKPLRVQMAGYKKLAENGETINGVKLNMHIDETAVLHLTKEGTYEFKLVPPNYEHFNVLLIHSQIMRDKEPIWKSIKAK
jgi:hypothetical protein